MNKRFFVIALGLVLAVAGVFGPKGQLAFAAATITSPATASISSDSALGSSVALPILTLTEGLAGDIATGTLTWVLPSGFVLDTSSPANVVYTGTGLSGSSVINFPDNTHFSLNISSTSTAAGSFSIGSATPLKAKATAGTPLATTGNTTLSTGTIAGIASTTNFGTLTQVPGSPAKLAFTAQPPAAITASSTVFGATVAVQDQFGNIVATDNGRVVTLSPTLVSSGVLGTLSGSTSINTNAGLAAYSGLAYNQTGTIQLVAQSAGLTSATSGQIVASSGSVPASTGLPNGILVKFPGDPTIYMVVNGTLRPFTTPAIFRAHGKKFEDVRELDNEHAHDFSIGKPVGESGDDNEDGDNSSSGTTTPVTVTSTPPTISGLPDGSVVKVAGNPTVYIVVNGQLQAIPSLDVFRAWHKKFEDVQTITDSQLQNLTLAGVAGFPDGTLLKGSGQTIYVVKNGQLYGIPDMGVMNRHGYKLQNIIRIQDKEMEHNRVGGVED